MTTTIFAPWLPNDTSQLARVTTIQIEMQHRWSVYSEYAYASGVGTKLNSIPHNFWGRGHPVESLYRIPRLAHFVDTTGCTPVPQRRHRGIPRSHHQIQIIGRCDHTTYWLGPKGEPLILTEPYRLNAEEVQSEISQYNLTAIVLPNPGIYAGGNNSSYSVLMGLPEHKDMLRSTLMLLHDNGWPAMSEVVEMDWVPALQFSKQQAQGVQL